MRFSLIFNIVSRILILCGITMSIPAIVDILNNDVDSAHRLFLAAATTVLSGLAIFGLTFQPQEPLRIKEMFVTTTCVWFGFVFFAALPFYFSAYHVSFTDAFFESASGMTTTGATIFKGLDTMNHGLLLWRSMLHWMGGLGIVVVALTILPSLHIGGMHFFATESTQGDDRTSPKMIHKVHATLMCFVILTVLCTLSLWWAGMTPFDAINHAMSTIATGGFSTHDTSIGFYNSPLIEWILILFMTIAGLPLILGLYMFQKRWQLIINNEQISTYFWFIFCSVFIISLYRWYHISPELSAFEGILRSTLFTVVSTITTTGFVTENYGLWGQFAIIFILFLLTTGACVGSTSGGIKMFRFTILSKTVITRLKSMMQPFGVFVPRYGNRAITDDVLIAVLVFMTFYIGTAVLGTLLLSLVGLDFMTALSGTFSSLSNVGPGLGPLIGPDTTYGALPSVAKWILSFCMLLGRLEFISIVMLTLPFLWKKNI